MKEFIYYPGSPEDSVRKTIIGIIKDSELHIGVATCFTGNSERKKDQFVKSTGRKIALGRAKESPCYVIQIPKNIEIIGKFFVEEVEKLFPKHISLRKPKVKPQIVKALVKAHVMN